MSETKENECHVLNQIVEKKFECNETEQSPEGAAHECKETTQQRKSERRHLKENNIVESHGSVRNTECEQSESLELSRGEYSQDESERQNSDEATEIEKQDAIDRKRRRKRRKKLTRRKLGYIESVSSDDSDNIPLIHLVTTNHNIETDFSNADTDLDKTYKPNSKDLNSKDTEYMSNISEKKRKKTLKEETRGQ